MLQNALDIATYDFQEDNVIDTYYARGLNLFSKLPDRLEKVGGIRWAIKKYFDSSLANKDGIRVSTKVQANVFVLFVVTIYILIYGINFTIFVMDDENLEQGLDAFIHNTLDAFGKAFFLSSNNTALHTDSTAIALTAVIAGLIDNTVITKEIDCVSKNMSQFLTPLGKGFAANFIETNCDEECSLLDEDFLCALTQGLKSFVPFNEIAIEQQMLLQAAGLNVSAIEDAANTVLESTIERGLDNVKPKQRYVIRAPLIIFTIVSTFISGLLALVVIPSEISTTLKLRSGVIPTFRSRNFSQYRESPDSVSLISGSLFWGCLFSSLTLGSMCALLVFIVLWPASRYLVLSLVATVIGEKMDD